MMVVPLDWSVRAQNVPAAPDIDLRPNYILNWLPAAGISAIINVRPLYILKGENFGTWSPWQQWTLTGA